MIRSGLARGLALALLAVLAAPVARAQQTLYLAGYGGSFEQTMRQEVLPAFEKSHNVKVEFVSGNSTDNLARLQAQKGNQQIDVVILDDGPMYQAVALSFCRELKTLPLNDILSVAHFKGNDAVGLGIVATGLMYNTKYFKDKNWPAPSSWNDLKDPKYKGLLVIPPLNNTYGLETLLMFAQLNGGGANNIDPGFKIMTNEVGPNVLVYEPSPGKMTELFQSGQAVIAVWGSARVQSFAQTGFPVEFVYPKEGALPLLTTACAIQKQNPSPLAEELIKHLLTPDVQKLLALKYGYGPVNKQVRTPAAGHRHDADRASRRVACPGRLGRGQCAPRAMGEALESGGRALRTEEAS